MQIKHGVSVFTRDEQEAGRVERVVIDPLTQEISHLVIGRSLFFNDSRIIPVQMIASADTDRIQLVLDKESLENLPYFEETHFVSPKEGDDAEVLEGAYVPPLYWYPPAGMATMGYPGYFSYSYPTQTEQNLPEGLVALQDGAIVSDITGEEIGEIEKVIVGEEIGQVTHFVVGWGLLQHYRKLIPAHWVEEVSENQVRLAVHKREVERLPEYKT
jgi:uncharacterized protein YrrD